MKLTVLHSRDGNPPTTLGRITCLKDDGDSPKAGSAGNDWLGMPRQSYQRLTSSIASQDKGPRMSDHQAVALEIDVQAAHDLLQSDSPPLLLDCREPFEVETVCMSKALTIPMQQIPQRLGELEQHRSERLIVYCHHGMRSQQVALWLRAQGFDNAQSMRGGIDAWAATIDPDMIRY